MDTKQLLDDFIEGKITEEQFDAEKAKLSPEALEQFNKDAAAKVPDAVEVLKNVRRGIIKIAKPAGEQAPAESELMVKQKEENEEEAFSLAFAELGIEKEEDKTAFKEGFKTTSSKSVNVKNIVKDMKSYYASANSDILLELKKQQREREIAAEEETNQAAGTNGSGSGGSGSGGEKLDKVVKEYMDKSAKAGRPITKEQAEKAIAIAKNGGRLPRP